MFYSKKLNIKEKVRNPITLQTNRSNGVILEEEGDLFVLKIRALGNRDEIMPRLLSLII
jgi:hypothetical protein